MKFMLPRSDDNKINIQHIDNLINLPIMNEAELLYSIKSRFINDSIFSYVGQTLVIVNPFKELPHLFNKDILENFQNCARRIGFTLKQEQPHIYAIAALAYNQLFEYQKPQSIVISGESGTGKTVNTKLCMSLIAQMSSQKQNKKISSGSNYGAGHHLEQQIIQCNPILEAFGNAKTIKNDNSSRFGKFVTIFIDMKTERIMGARTQSYLLEKSRVIYQSKEERNYHIFYSLLSSHDSSLLDKLGLKDKNKKALFSDFNYLNKSECYEVSTINDSTNFIDVNSSFSTLEIDDIDPTYTWQIIASVLHLGNLDFDDSYQDNTGDSPCQIKEKGRSTIDKISELLGVPSDKFREALLKKKIKVGNNETVSSKIKIDVVSHLHSLSKDLYDKLFMWLIKRINSRLLQINDRDLMILQQQSQLKQIGLLDIFGFEVLQHNSLEQLCINYANEVLQQLYIEYTFKAEQLEFFQQELQQDFSQIPFNDNSDVISLLDKPNFGLFPQIDEISSLATSGDDSLYNKIKEQHKSNPLILVPTIKSDKFTIQHTPRQVQYSITGFRAKNKDEMSASFINILAESRNPILNEIYNEEVLAMQQASNNTKAAQNKDKFIGFKFRKQIGQLIQELRQSDVHFIRCIKPNENKMPNMFVDEIIINQLRYLGVLDTIKIRKEGFPIRKEYKDFYRKFGEIELNTKSFYQLEKQGADFKFQTEAMKIWENNFQIKDQKKQVLFGKTKICFRSEAYDELEVIYGERMKTKTEAATKIQKIARGYIARKYLKELKRKIKIIKRWFVSRYVRITYLKIRKAVQVIQRFFRACILKKTRKMAMIIQKYMKRTIQMRKYQQSMKKIIESQRFIKKQIQYWKQKRYTNIKRTIVLNGFNIAWSRLINRNATLIQKRIRGYLVRNVFHKDKIQHVKIYMKQWYQNKAATQIQRIVRGVLGRKYVQARWMSAMKIQGFIRSKWLNELRLKFKRAATYIQKFYKKYSDMTKNQRSYFVQEDSILQNINAAEQSALLSSKMVLLDSSRKESAFIHLDSKEARISRDHLTPQDKKISFFLLILDYEILTDTSEIYDPLWNKQFSNLSKDMIFNNHDITHIQVGDAHTIASSTNGKLYCWGWNDHGQLGIDILDGLFCSKKATPIPWIEEITRPKLFSVGSNHTFILDVENNLYVQGQNNQGQLGLGHNEIVVDPERLDINMRVDDRIKILKSRYEQSIVITEKGTAFMWPLTTHNSHSTINQPFELAFPASKIQIAYASCGQKFSMFLSNSGLVFSLGSNEQGELGLGDTQYRSAPCLIESLKIQGEKIQQIECGQKHTISKSGLNRIFTWGMGSKGQLGHDSKSNEYQPRAVNLSNNYNKFKVMQVQASQKSCIILLENKKLLWWGTNNHLRFQLNPIEIDLNNHDKYLNNNDFYPIKIETTWSKSLSITYLRIADTRTFDQNTQFKTKLINTLISKWQESYLNTMDVPFFESISKNLSNRHVLKNYSNYKRIGPKYPKQRNEKYSLVQNSSPTKNNNELQNINHTFQDENYANDTLNISQSSNSSPLKNNSNNNNNDVFDNFVRSSSKKQLKVMQASILNSQNDPRTNIDEHKLAMSPFVAKQSQNGNREDEYLLDTIKVSPNSLLERYKNEQRNSSQKISQFEINVHKVPTILPANNLNSSYKSKGNSSQRLQPPQSQQKSSQSQQQRYLKQPSNIITRNSIDSQQSSNSQISFNNNNNNNNTSRSYSNNNNNLNRSKSKDKSKQSVTFEDFSENNNNNNNNQNNGEQYYQNQKISYDNLQMMSNHNNNNQNNQNDDDISKYNQYNNNYQIQLMNNKNTQNNNNNNINNINNNNINNQNTMTNSQSSNYSNSVKRDISPNSIMRNDSQQKKDKLINSRQNGLNNNNNKQQMNQQAIKELKFNQVTKDQVKYPFIQEEQNIEHKTSENDTFINSLHQKLAGIKSRMQTLGRIPKEEWTLDDHQFMSEVSNSKMIEFFKNIS